MDTKSEIEGNDRDSRVQSRRNRIEVRNVNKDDEKKKKKMQVSEAKKMSRGQQQIADSLNQLDRRKVPTLVYKYQASSDVICSS